MRGTDQAGSAVPKAVVHNGLVEWAVDRRRPVSSGFRQGEREMTLLVDFLRSIMTGLSSFVETILSLIGIG